VAAGKLDAAASTAHQPGQAPKQPAAPLWLSGSGLFAASLGSEEKITMLHDDIDMPIVSQLASAATVEHDEGVGVAAFRPMAPSELALTAVVEAALANDNFLRVARRACVAPLQTGKRFVSVFDAPSTQELLGLLDGASRRCRDERKQHCGRH
jgi:hypothetical protein